MHKFLLLRPHLPGRRVMGALPLLLMVWWMVFSSVAVRAKERRSVVRLETNMGVIRIALFDETPIHRDNFLKLVDKGFYDGLLFHRVIKDFMIQGGDPDSKGAPRDSVLGNGGVGYVIPPEFYLPYIFHWRGTVAAARLGDEVNPEQYSSGCQFYIVWGKKFGPASLSKAQAAMAEKGVEITRQMGDVYEVQGGTPHLDGGYTVFGEVIKGLDVVDHIQRVATDEHDRPMEDVVIVKAEVEQRSKEARR